jgi:hypothetical protein
LATVDYSPGITRFLAVWSLRSSGQGAPSVAAKRLPARFQPSFPPMTRSMVRALASAAVRCRAQGTRALVSAPGPVSPHAPQYDSPIDRLLFKPKLPVEHTGDGSARQTDITGKFRGGADGLGASVTRHWEYWTLRRIARNCLCCQGTGQAIPLQHESDAMGIAWHCASAPALPKKRKGPSLLFGALGP